MASEPRWHRRPEPRSAALRPDEMSAKQRELFAHLVASRGRATPLLDAEGRLRGPFDAMLRAPGVGSAFQSVGEALRFGEGELDAAERELATLVVAAAFESSYEWEAHARLAAEAGLDSEAIDRVARRETPSLHPARLACVHDTARELVEAWNLSDAAHARACAELGEPALSELVMLVGYYATLALLLRTFGNESRP